MRFADHRPLVEPGPGIRVHDLDAAGGFEAFTSQVHAIIGVEGKEAYYVFDCLSFLLDVWATDLMIGNFFMVTCPYLFELDTIAYFALIRNRHSFATIARIRETTQLLLDLYNIDGRYCLHPLKVWKRYSPTMFLPHLQQDAEYVPITSSVDATKLLAYISERGLKPAERALDYWDRLFLQATELSENPDASEMARQHTLDRLCRVMIGRDERILTLAKKHFTLEDLCAVKSRLIGTGFVGGKAVGMLLANKIVSKDEFDLSRHLEPHDSFYVGSDVFYTYLVENGCWKLRMEQKTRDGYFGVAAELRDRLLKGRFPDQVRDQFQEMIEYFGQSPIIVRSSSLLEDAFGNAFAGKYESIFCVNQGGPEKRYANFVEAVRKVYASTMRSRWPCWFSGYRAHTETATSSRIWPASACRTMRLSGNPTSIRRRGCSGWYLALARGRSIVLRTITRKLLLSTSLLSGRSPVWTMSASTRSIGWICWTPRKTL